MLYYFYCSSEVENNDKLSMPMLKLSKDDPKKELEFEVKFQLSLTIQQRFRMMWGEDAIAWLKFAREHEHIKTPLIIKRS